MTETVVTEQVHTREDVLTGDDAAYVAISLLFLATSPLREPAMNSNITLHELQLRPEIQNRTAFKGSSLPNEITAVSSIFRHRLNQVREFLKQYYIMNGINLEQREIFPSQRPRLGASTLEGTMYLMADANNDVSIYQTAPVPSTNNVTVCSESGSCVLERGNYLRYNEGHELNTTNVQYAFDGDGDKVFTSFRNIKTVSIPDHIAKRRSGKSVVMFKQSAITTILTACSGTFDSLPAYGTDMRSGVEIGRELTVHDNKWVGTLSIRPERNTHVNMFGISVPVNRLKVVCTFVRNGESSYVITGLITIIPLDSVERVSLVNRAPFATRASDIRANRNVHVQGVDVSDKQYDEIRRCSNMTEPWSRVPLGTIDKGSLVPLNDAVTHLTAPGSSMQVPVPRHVDSYGLVRTSGVEITDVIMTMNHLRRRNAKAHATFIHEIQMFFYEQWVQRFYAENDTPISFNAFLLYVSTLMRFSVSIGIHNEMIECRTKEEQTMLCANSQHMLLSDFFAYHFYCLTWRVRLESAKLPLVMGSWMSVPYFCPPMPDARGFIISSVMPWCSGFFKHMKSQVGKAYEALNVDNPLAQRAEGMVSGQPSIIGISRGILTDGTVKRDGVTYHDGNVVIKHGKSRLCLDNVIRDAMKRMEANTSGIIYDSRFVLLLIKGDKSNKCVCFVTTSTKVARILPATKNSDALVEREHGVRAYVHEYDMQGSGYINCI